MSRVIDPPEVNLSAELRAARELSDAFFSLLRPGALAFRPIPERHRFIFYLGHLEAFDWNLIARRTCGQTPFDDRFDRLFSFGIDPVDGRLPDEPFSAWPGLERIEDYGRRSRTGVDACLRQCFRDAHADELGPPPLADVAARRGGRAATSNEALRSALEMALEHRLMHLETLAYMLRWLPHEEKNAPEVAELAMAAGGGRGTGGRLPLSPRNAVGRAARPEVVRIPAGAATLGRRRSDRGFGWDNEYEAHRVEVPAFTIDSDKVTNAHYLEFVLAGGYGMRGLWSEDAWRWIRQNAYRHPAGWTERHGVWYERAAFRDRPLLYAAPVLVAHAEAAAFARWSGAALPSEAQYHRAAYGTPEGEEREYPWGGEAPDATRGNFGLVRWETTPVDAHPGSDSAFGVRELVGNGWEWTSTAFGPFPGFVPDPRYEGYSRAFFDGTHRVLKGASCRTSTRLVRRSFRNWFQPRYPYGEAAFRLVR